METKEPGSDLGTGGMCLDKRFQVPLRPKRVVSRCCEASEASREPSEVHKDQGGTKRLCGRHGAEGFQCS